MSCDLSAKAKRRRVVEMTVVLMQRMEENSGMKIYNYKIKISDVVLALILIALAVFRLPTMLANFAMEGKTIPVVSRQVIGSGESISYPPEGGAVTIYWATWCAPCKLEMSRLQKSVEAGEIPRDRVFAISLGEDAATISAFLKKNNYPFTFLGPSPQDETFQIAATPTLVLLKDRQVVSVGTGPSVWGIWRAEGLF